MIYCTYAMSTALLFAGKRHDADDVTSFFFLTRPPFVFLPGQFLDLRLEHPDADARGTSRPFTIASAPSEPLLRITTRIRGLPSTFKQALSRLVPGDVVDASGPYGEFVCADPRGPVVFIAGGIGITPFRSMLAELAARRRRPAITLLYSNASQDIPFRAFFDGLQPAWPELRLAYTVTRPLPRWGGPIGRIDARFIRANVANMNASRFFVCGPSGFAAAIAGTLHDLGIPDGRIKREGFPGYEPAAESARVALV